MNVPVHDYMTYKKNSTLGYFSTIKPQNFTLRHDNQVYNTMKSFYFISKIFRSLKKDDQNRKSKTALKFKFMSKKLSLENPQVPPSNLHTLTQFKSPSSFLNTSIDQTISLSRGKSVCSHVERTKTEIEEIKAKACKFHSRLENNKKQINVVKNYNKLLDTYFDKIPSPTASVTRQSLQEEEKFNKICKEDIKLMMNRDKHKFRYKKIDEFHEPNIPENIINQLSEDNKQGIQIEKDRKQFMKHNKIRIKQKFLNYFPYGKEAKKIAERSKSQGLINISNF